MAFIGDLFVLVHIVFWLACVIASTIFKKLHFLKKIFNVHGIFGSFYNDLIWQRQRFANSKLPAIFVPDEIKHEPEPVPLPIPLQQKTDIAVTSTPVQHHPPVKFRHPKHDVSGNGSVSDVQESQKESPLRINVVKPVKMPDLESFSPIVASTKGNE